MCFCVYVEEETQSKSKQVFRLSLMKHLNTFYMKNEADVM